MRKHIPNILTLANLISGCIGIVYTLEGNVVEAAYFVWIACVFDFFDGFSARMLKVSSPIGKELDSLADVVSFGVLPSMVMFSLLTQSTSNAWLPYTAFVIAAFSALRLAIFNLDETQSDSFRGLPTPANALFLTGLPFLFTALPIISNTYVLLVICLCFSILLVARIELFALKFKDFNWSTNKTRFTFLIVSVLLLVMLKFQAIPVVILFYILLSAGIHYFRKQSL